MFVWENIPYHEYMVHQLGMQFCWNSNKRGNYFGKLGGKKLNGEG